jgi:hypothetical protein
VNVANPVTAADARVDLAFMDEDEGGDQATLTN